MNMLKAKNSQWTIEDLGQFKVDSIISEVISYQEEWLTDTSRQDNSITHKQTEMYQLIYSDYGWRNDQNIPLEIEEKNSFKQKESIKEIQTIYTFLENKFNGKICRSEIVKLKANSNIRKHVDGGWWLQYARRCHIPLVTDPKILFTVEDNTIHMEVGRIYEINNSVRHSVSNPTEVERIHIIVDVMPKEMLQ